MQLVVFVLQSFCKVLGYFKAFNYCKIVLNGLFYDINYSKSIKSNFFPTKNFKLVDYSGLNLKAEILSLELKSSTADM